MADEGKIAMFLDLHQDEDGRWRAYHEDADGHTHELTGPSKEALQQTIAELALPRQDRFRFLEAWKAGVRRFPQFFRCDADSIDEAVDINQLRPLPDEDWEAMFSGKTRNQILFLGAMVSFFNQARGGEVLAAVDGHSPGEVICGLDRELRQILAELIAHYRGW